MIFAQVLQVTWMKTVCRKRVLQLQSKYVNIVVFLMRKWKRGYFSVENTQTEWGSASATLALFDFGLLNDRVKALTWSGWDTTVANLNHWQIGSNLTDVYVSPAVSTWQITSEYRYTTDVCKVLHSCKVHCHLVISGFFLFFTVFLFPDVAQLAVILDEIIMTRCGGWVLCLFHNFCPHGRSRSRRRRSVWFWLSPSTVDIKHMERHVCTECVNVSHLEIVQLHQAHARGWGRESPFAHARRGLGL